jgi:hypothetical protein
VNFVEDAEQAQISPYLSTVFDSILNLLVRSKHFVQDRVLAALSSLASAVNEEFNPYYPRVMPLLFDVLERPGDNDDTEMKTLKGRALECAGRIGA